MKTTLLKINFFLFVFFLFSNSIFSQSVGDYRSTGSGNWTTLASWQYFNGVTWVLPSGIAPQGFPGQFTGTGIVTIQNGHSITINSSTPNDFSGLVVGQGSLSNLIVGADVDVRTLNLKINASALVQFSGNNFIRFPEKTSIVIDPLGKFDNGGTCNNNVAVYIGTVKFAVCKGSGNAELSFDQINQGGGTITAVLSSNSPVCQNEIVNLVRSYSGTVGTTIPNGGAGTTGVNYSWSIKAPDNTIATSTTQNPSFTASQSGTYLATLNISTFYGSAVYSNSNTISVIVNASPVITLQPINELDCEGSIVNFKIAASGTGLSYIWQRKRPIDMSFITIPVEGNVTYPSPSEIRLVNVGSAQSKDGTQYQVVVSNGICSVTSGIGKLSVNEITDVLSPALVPAQSILNVTLCCGANYSYTVLTSYPSNVFSYQWKKSILSGTWTDVVDGANYSGAKTATLSIINGTPSESGEYRVYITFNNTTARCSTDSSSRKRLITFLPLLTAPLTTITQPNCITPTGTIDVTIQSTSDTYSFDNGVNYQTANIKEGLAPGTYKIIIKNIGGCLSTVTNSEVNIPAISTWNGSLWSPRTPTINDAIVFDGNYSSSADLSGCSCRVNFGADVVFNSPHTLAITNAVTVNSGGSLIFKSDLNAPSSSSASLVQLNNVSTNNNSGFIKYERMTNTVVLNTDYTYWSSPVANFTLGGVSPKTLTGMFYSFNSNIEDWQQESSATIMNAGNGYIIRGPEPGTGLPSPPSPYLALFNGVPNNGHYGITGISAGRSCFLGNPYPSAIDADILLSQNSGILDGTLYFWTHNTAISLSVTNPGSVIYTYSQDDYASYNTTGGVGIDSFNNPYGANKANSIGANTNIPSGKIAAGQGFFGTSKAIISSNEIVFNNDMRVSGIVGNNSQFFKLNNIKGKTTAAIEKNRVWLNLTNALGAFKQILIGYVTGASNDSDSNFDGRSFDGQEFVDFYSINQGENLVIQGRALPFDEKDIVLLGYRSAIDGDFTINIDQTDGFFSNQVVFLEDKLTSTITNLKRDNYTFNTTSGVFNDRFVLHYTNKTLGTKDVDLLGKRILIFSKNKEIKISSLIDAIDSVLIYDLSGKQIYKKIKVNNNQLVINSLPSGKRVLLVKVMLDNGESITKKIIY
jgi:hypothetical protein